MKALKEILEGVMDLPEYLVPLGAPQVRKQFHS